MTYDITQSVKNGWMSKLNVFKKTKNWNIENQILHQNSPRIPRDSPLYDSWWGGKTWNKDFNWKYEISNTEFVLDFDDLARLQYPSKIHPKSSLNHQTLSLGSLFGSGRVQEALWECPGESWGCPGLHFGMILSSQIHPKSMKNRHQKTMRFEKRFFLVFRWFWS